MPARFGSLLVDLRGAGRCPYALCQRAELGTDHMLSPNMSCTKSPEVIREKHGVALSMDGKGCGRDNVMIERFWRSLKYEEVYLHAYDGASAAKSCIGKYIHFYNNSRPHSALDGRAPDAVYFTQARAKIAA
jgi:transposase InsO family protein